MITSFGQQALWFLQSLQPDNPAYNIAFGLELPPEAVESLFPIWQYLIDRHAILRTVYRLRDGQLSYETPPRVLQIQPHDAREWDEDSLQAFISDQSDAPFDLSGGSLCRLTLIQRTPRDIILIGLHHSIADFLSIATLWGEWQILYQQWLSGEILELPPLNTSYAEFAKGQRLAVESGALEKDWNYWRDRLGAPPIPLTLGQATSRQPVGATYQAQLSSDIWQRLRAFSRTHCIKPYVILLSSFMAFLHRQTGENHIWTGSPVSLRSPEDFPPPVGYFVNTLVMTADFSHGMTGIALFQHIARRVEEALDHKDFPLSELVKRLGLTSQGHASPLFQSMFIYNRPMVPPEPAFPIVEILPEQKGCVVDLSLMIVAYDDEPRIVWQYNQSVISPDQIKRWNDQYMRLLDLLISQPDHAIARLQILSDEEISRQYLWNQTQVSWPEGYWFDFFSEQIEKTPDAIAVVSGGEILSYRDLWRQVEKLSSLLLSRGVQAGDRLALILPRSVEQLLIWLTGWRIGAICCPLNPLDPEARLTELLSSLKPVLVLSDRDWEGYQTLSAEQCKSVDPSEGNILPDCLSFPPLGKGQSPCGKGDLAYIIHTSGSTGSPKGVMIGHDGTRNHHLAARQLFGLGAGDRVLQFHQLSFDAALEEIFPAWISGATLVLSPFSHAPTPHELNAFLRDQGITVMSLPTAYWQLWVQHTDELPPSLRLVVIGGEQASEESFRLWHELAKGKVRLLNTYGPTEATIIATYSEASSFIGRPIANMQTWVLNEQGQLMGIDEPGELWLAGPGVSLGYWQRPEETSRHFFPNPFGKGAIYRTGDRAMRLADGSLKWLGRIDRQVKIRGYRVEPEAIEQTLLHHPLVKQAAIVVNHQSQLIGYLASESLTESGIKLWLSQQLPTYACPSHWVIWPELPLNANGKTDYAALPRWEAAEAVTDETILPFESRLATLWRELLQRPNIGKTDNFFDLGGHSLLAAQLAASLEDWGYDVPIALIFEHPTLETQAAAILSGNLTSSINWDAEVRSFKLNPPCPPFSKRGESIETRNSDDITSPLPKGDESIGNAEAKRATLLLTGATGFLGVFLLRSLMRHTDYSVICPVRATDDATASDRLISILRSKGVWDEGWRDRVHVIAGDLKRERLGLSPEAWDDLSQGISCILHNGAEVNFLATYSALKPANVEGTKTLMRLAALSDVPFHFVSTVAAEGARDREGLAAGYAQSKWVAEQLILQAKGISSRIYRLGRLASDRETGIWQSDDILYRFLQACVQAGSYPDWDIALDLTPVDGVADAMVQLICTSEITPIALMRAEHSPTLHELMAWTREAGFQIGAIAPDEWLIQMQASASDLEHPLAPFLGVPLSTDLFAPVASDLPIRYVPSLTRTDWAQICALTLSGKTS